MKCASATDVILAIDPGKNKGVACLNVFDAAEVQFVRSTTWRAERREPPECQAALTAPTASSLTRSAALPA
jgi:hypothetical protein